jgi:hypothetical protein
VYTTLRRVLITIIVTYYEYVCIVPLVTKNKSRILSALFYIVICGLCVANVFPHVTSQTARIKKNTEHRMWVLILSTICLWNCFINKFPFNIFINFYTSLCKMRLFLVRLQQNLKFLDRFIQKSSNIISKENQSSMCRVVPCRQTERYVKTNSRFPNFAKVPTGSTVCHKTCLLSKHYLNCK